jgi:hypothetical protein
MIGIWRVAQVTCLTAPASRRSNGGIEWVHSRLQPLKALEPLAVIGFGPRTGASLRFRKAIGRLRRALVRAPQLQPELP